MDLLLPEECQLRHGPYTHRHYGGEGSCALPPSQDFFFMQGRSDSSLLYNLRHPHTHRSLSRWKRWHKRGFLLARLSWLIRTALGVSQSGLNTQHSGCNLGGGGLSLPATG